jgi:hypothetical protein
MKGLFKVLGIILMVIGLAGSVILGLRDFTDASKMAELESSAATTSGQSKEMAEAVLAGTKKLLGAENLTSGSFRSGGITALVSGLLLLALIVLLLAKKDRRYVQFLAALLVVVIASVLLNPSIDAGPNGPLSSRTLALIVGLIGVGGALLGQASNALRRKAAKA